MARIEYEKIKARHTAAADRFLYELEDEGFDSVLDTQISSEAADFIRHSHDDMGSLIREHDRFVANYREALEFIDSFAMSHKSVLPRRTAEGLTDLQARLRGLL